MTPESTNSPARAPRVVLDRVVSWLKHRLHLCAHDGCWQRGNSCYLPDNTDGKPDDYACWEHTHDLGYCWCCGTFWGGVESFDFGNGTCENCRADMAAEEEHECWDEIP